MFAEIAKVNKRSLLEIVLSGKGDNKMRQSLNHDAMVGVLR